MPADLLALLPSPDFPPASLESVLLGRGQGADEAATSALPLPIEVTRFLAQEEAEAVGRILQLVSELEEERGLLVQALERQRRERDRLREQLRLAQAAGGRTRAAGPSMQEPGPSHLQPRQQEPATAGARDVPGPPSASLGPGRPQDPAEIE